MHRTSFAICCCNSFAVREVVQFYGTGLSRDLSQACAALCWHFTMCAEYAWQGASYGAVHHSPESIPRLVTPCSVPWALCVYAPSCRVNMARVATILRPARTGQQPQRRLRQRPRPLSPNSSRRRTAPVPMPPTSRLMPVATIVSSEGVA